MAKDLSCWYSIREYVVSSLSNRIHIDHLRSVLNMNMNNFLMIIKHDKSHWIDMDWINMDQGYIKDLKRKFFEMINIDRMTYQSLSNNSF